VMIALASYSPPRPLYYPPYCLEHPEFPRITNTGSPVSKKISSRQIHHIINIPEHKKQLRHMAVRRSYKLLGKRLYIKSSSLHEN
jgi:hypothetical protein